MKATTSKPFTLDTAEVCGRKRREQGQRSARPSRTRPFTLDEVRKQHQGQRYAAAPRTGLVEQIPMRSPPAARLLPANAQVESYACGLVTDHGHQAGKINPGQQTADYDVKLVLEWSRYAQRLR
jgi:hypothetical protein